MDQEERLYSENVKHLEMLQGVISRFAGNSFLIKGWTLTLSAAMLGFAASTGSRKLSAIGSVVVLAFWLLDAVYLRQERLYRMLYDHVRANPSLVDRFSMNAWVYRSKVSFLRAVVARTLVVYYSGILIVAVAAVVFAPALPKLR